jgi:hypothetical protein
MLNVRLLTGWSSVYCRDPVVDPLSTPSPFPSRLRCCRPARGWHFSTLRLSLSLRSIAHCVHGLPRCAVQVGYSRRSLSTLLFTTTLWKSSTFLYTLRPSVVSRAHLHTSYILCALHIHTPHLSWPRLPRGLHLPMRRPRTIQQASVQSPCAQIIGRQ